MSRRHELAAFLGYVTGKQAQASVDGTQTGRSWRRRTSWCWQVPPPPPVLDGVVHEQVFMDGLHIRGRWVLLVASSPQGPVNWLVAAKESSAAYNQLLAPIPAPDLATTDGAGGALKAIKATWGTDQPTQRCLVHVHRNNTADLTRNPATAPGRALAVLSRRLLDITTTSQATAWATMLNDFHTTYAAYLRERTYASNDPAQAAARGGRRWWYTHERDRRVYQRLARLYRDKTLFAYLEAHPGQVLAATTNPIESINARLRALLRAHAGWSPQRQLTALQWYLAATQHGLDPAAVLTQWNNADHPTYQLIDKPAPTPTATRTYDTAYDPQDGNHTRKGWAH